VRRSSRLILLLGIFLAVGAFVLILFLGGGRGPSATPTPAVAHIVKAVVDIPQGTTITESMVTVEEVPLTEAPNDSFALPERVIGKTARQTVASGAYVPTAAIEGSAAATVDLAKELNPGERAVALRFDNDPSASVAFLVQPGDRVDVIVTVTNVPVGFTFSLESGSKTPSDVPAGVQGNAGGTGFQVIPPDKANRSTAKLLFQNIRVVYARQDVAAPPQGQTPAPGSLTPTAETVILALNPQQAEAWSFIQTQTGAADATTKLYLALRSPQDAQASPDTTTGVVLRTLIDAYGVLPPRLVIVDQQGR
jgi:Flp pilus assembly protein CpaB